jgi:hypothetical protein
MQVSAGLPASTTWLGKPDKLTRCSTSAYLTPAAPVRIWHPAVTGGAYTTPPHSRHAQVVCPPAQLHGWCPTSALPGPSR